MRTGIKRRRFLGSRVLARSFGLAHGFETYDDDMGPQNALEQQVDTYAERRDAP